MVQHSFGPPGDFTDLVRDALLHLCEPAYLQGHPLLTFRPVGSQGRMPADWPGRSLRQAILDAIEALHPEAGTPISSRAWRTYRILELRYIEGQDGASTVRRCRTWSTSSSAISHQSPVTSVSFSREERPHRLTPHRLTSEEGHKQ